MLCNVDIALPKYVIKLWGVRDRFSYRVVLNLRKNLKINGIQDKDKKFLIIY